MNLLLSMPGAGEWLAIIFFAILGTFATAWIFSIVFGAKKQRKLLEAQLDLLGRIAKQQGVSNTEIYAIMKAAGRNTYFTDKS